MMNPVSLLRRLAKALEHSRLLAGLVYQVRGWVFRRRTRASDVRARPIIAQLISEWTAQEPLAVPTHIEIETINRCNGGCSFCPVNQSADPRVFQKMSEAMFVNIIEQLGRMNYAGVLSLYSNNEPLLDKRSYDFHAMARRGVPHATIMLVTNGTALNVERFLRLIPSVDIVRIDNYSDQMVLKDNIREIKEYWEAHPIAGKEVSIVVRRENEIRTSRGGAAPNREQIRTLESSCLLPFMQMVIRPDGKLSLCCNDALGHNTLGDLAKETIFDAWNGATYRKFRAKIQNGRGNIDTCAGCDTLLGVDHPALNALPAYAALRKPLPAPGIDVV